NPEDEFSLIQFSDHAELVAPFTKRVEEIQNRLMFLRPKGRTALLAALYMDVNQLKRAEHRRRAILIISDGGDNASRYSTREVKNGVKEADVYVYSLGILTPR